MFPRPEDKQRTKSFEGFRALPYLDTKGIPTVGYGFNINAVREMLPETVIRGLPLSMEDADKIFNILYMRAVSWAIIFANEAWPRLSDNRKCVLSDMAYNLGLSALLKFTHLKSALDKGDYDWAADEMIDSQWYRQTGQRAKSNVEMMRET